MMKKKISAVLLLVFLVSFSAVLQSCTTENQSSDLSKVEHSQLKKKIQSVFGGLIGQSLISIKKLFI